MRVLYFNNCWFENVGEAFIDIGAMELIKRVFNNPQIVNISAMNNFYIKKLLSDDEQYEYLGMSRYYSGDYIVFAGLFASEIFINGKLSFSPNMLRNFKKKGAKVIFLGLGQAKYSDTEIDKFKKFLEEIKPELIVSRDNAVYENFKDVAPSINGIDCAFWVNDVYNPKAHVDVPYDVVAFNRSEYPKDFTSEREIITAYHFQYYMNKDKLKNNMLISDTPYDYLTLYANAEKVYTDLVHATIASLQYGTHVKFCPVDKRGYAVEALKDIIKYDEDGYMYLKIEELNRIKARIEMQIKEKLG